ncbi:MAG: glutamate--tRNA ligase [Bacteroidales bacterium]|jgi:glutamyl-tRNA synthetase|nr:glutamate--tRNA ligase [Bacteroidales bacterium]
MTEIRTRFAPSPTGFMHIGNLRTALYCYLYARHNNGKFILRIEDTDQQRQVENAVEVIYNTLLLSGLVHDEGPDVGGSYGPYVQSERKTIYAKYAQQLIEKGAAYYCFCGKERLDSLVDESGTRKYDKHCLHLSPQEISDNLASGIPYVIRQNVPLDGTTTFIDQVYGEITVENKELHDNVLMKSDGLPTYNFANVVDDHLMEISHVFRGMEYLSSTPNYNLLYNAFGWEIPQYVHLPHIMRDKSHKLSKRQGDANFEDFYNKGYLPEAILNYVALLGWNPKTEQEQFSLEELVQLFDIAGISKSSAIFDPVKLRWLNGLYIKEMDVDEFLTRALPFYRTVKTPVSIALLSTLLQSRIGAFTDIPEKIAFIDNYDNYDLALFENKDAKTTLDMARQTLPVVLNALRDLQQWTNEAIFSLYSTLTETLGIKKKQLLWIVRIALTGHASTPCGASEMCVLIGKKLSLKRLEETVERL